MTPEFKRPPWENEGELGKAWNKKDGKMFPEEVRKESAAQLRAGEREWVNIQPLMNKMESAEKMGLLDLDAEELEELKETAQEYLDYMQKVKPEEMDEDPFTEKAKRILDIEPPASMAG